MSLEKRWSAVPAVALTVNGGSDGKVTVSSTSGFKVKQLVNLKSNAPASLEFRVQRVESSTVLYLGPKDGKINSRSDLSAFTTALSSTIEAVEQLRPSIPQLEYERAVYEEEPTVAKRNVMVDQYGNFYDVDNPLAVRLSDGSINIGTVNAELEVQLSARDNDPDAGDVHDSIRIGSQNNEAEVNNNKQLEVHDLRNAIQGMINTSKFLALGNPDNIVPNFTGNTLTLDYYEDEALIGQGVFTYTDATDWELSLFAYINDDNGDRLLDDDDSFLLLE